MAPKVVTAINIDGTSIHTAFNIPINRFGKKWPRKLRSSLRNQLDLKVITINEISMVSVDLLFHVHLRLTEVFGTVNNLPVGGKPVYANYKNSWQVFNSLQKLFKIFELTWGYVTTWRFSVNLFSKQCLHRRLSAWRYRYT